MKLLLTGATGFIGSNLLINALQDPDIESIIVLIRNHSKLEHFFQTNIPYRPEKLRVIETDITVCGHLPTDITHVIHCAGELFAKDVSAFYRVNCEGTQNLFANLPPEIPAVALSSQSAVGPTPTNTPTCTDRTIPSPLSHYGKSKLLMEQKLFAMRPNSPIWIIRAPIVLGPHDDAIKPLFKMVKSPIRLQVGNTIKYYSWIGIKDLITAIFTALRTSNQPKCPTSYFVRSNRTISSHDLIREAAHAVNCKGLTIGIPNYGIKLISQLIEMSPALRTCIPSLGPDRVIELYPDRWIIDDCEFRQTTGWAPHQTLTEVMQEIARWI